jgi:hypothetical protein
MSFLALCWFSYNFGKDRPQRAQRIHNQNGVWKLEFTLSLPATNLDAFPNTDLSR